MNNRRNGSLGLLEKVILEFKQKGCVSIKEVKAHLKTKHSLTMSDSLIKKRVDSMGF